MTLSTYTFIGLLLFMQNTRPRLPKDATTERSHLKINVDSHEKKPVNRARLLTYTLGELAAGTAAIIAFFKIREYMIPDFFKFEVFIGKDGKIHVKIPSAKIHNFFQGNNANAENFHKYFQNQGILASKLPNKSAFSKFVGTDSTSYYFTPEELDRSKQVSPGDCLISPLESLILFCKSSHNQISITSRPSCTQGAIEDFFRDRLKIDLTEIADRKKEFQNMQPTYTTTIYPLRNKKSLFNFF